MRRIVIFGLLLCFSRAAFSQADCPALVDAAFNATNELCADLGRNEACYGNLLLSATPREDAAAFNFEQAGDRVPVADIQSLQLSAMSLTDETWGVALMELQANLPDTLPGQNVTVLLFGDVQVSSAATTLTAFNVTATGGVNVRLRPTTSEDNVIGGLSSGQTVLANGRLADGTWVRVILDAETQQVGWVSADYLTTDGDLNTLNVVEADAPTFNAMQAFYFSSSIGDSACAEAPDSGILIQTPQGAGEVLLRVNEVDIRLGSTVYLQTGGGVMRVSVVEGHAALTADSVTQTVPAGTYAEIPLDANGLADGAPTFPQPYAMADVQALPVSVALPQSVSIAPPIRGEDNIQVAIDIADGLPPSGLWMVTWRVIADNAPCDNQDYTGNTWNMSTALIFGEDHQTLTLPDDGSGQNGPIVMHRNGENTYEWSNGLLTLRLLFTGVTTFNIQHDGQYGDPATGGCGSFLQEGSGVYVGQ